MEELLKRIQVLLDTNAIWLPLDAPPVSIEPSIRELQDACGFALPDDFKLFLQLYPQGFVLNGVVLEVISDQTSTYEEEDVDFCLFTGFDCGPGLNIVGLTKEWQQGLVYTRSEQLPGHIVIGQSSQGHPFLLGPLTSGFVSIYDMWSAGSTDDPVSTFRFEVAKNFTHLLKLLVEGIEAQQHVS